MAWGVGAQEWTRFRGPNGSGCGLATNLPSRWAEADFRWRVRLPGVGHSSPVLWGDRLCVTGAEDQSRHLLVVCLNADTGMERWRRGFPLPAYTIHRNNTLATATPATDERRVYLARVEGKDLRLTALEHAEGAPAWEYTLGPLRTEHGLGHSPMVYDGRVILAYDHDLSGGIVALEASTGRLLWKTPRRSGRADYSTPCLFDSGTVEPYLVVNTQEDGIGAIKAATGRVVWQLDDVLSMRSVSSPIVASGLVFGTCGSGGGGNYLVALRPGRDRAGRPEVAYQIRKSAPYVPTPLASGELLFLWSDGGIVTCARAATGEAIWQERVGGNYFSSPVLADGKLINLSTTGDVVMLAARARYELLGRNALGEVGHATPAVARGCLFVRTLTQLVAVGSRSDLGAHAAAGD